MHVNRLLGLWICGVILAAAGCAHYYKVNDPVGEQGVLHERH